MASVSIARCPQAVGSLSIDGGPTLRPAADRHSIEVERAFPRRHFTQVAATEPAVGVVGKALALFRKHERAVGAVILGAVAIPAQIGCSLESDAKTESLKDAQRPAASEELELAAEVLFDASAARQRLVDLGVPASAVAGVDAATLGRAEALVVKWKANNGSSWTNAHGAELMRIAGSASTLVELWDAVPARWLHTPSDLQPLLTNWSTPDKGIERAKDLEARFGYRPVTRDLGTLERMTGDGCATLESLLETLQSRGLYFVGTVLDIDGFGATTELDALIALAPIIDGATVPVDVRHGLLDPSGSTLQVDLTQLTAGVDALTARGISFTPAHIEAAALLGEGSARSERLSSLLDRASPPRDVRSTEELAYRALRPLVDGSSDTKALLQLDVLRDRLGRDLAANEIGAALDAFARGTSAGQLVSRAHEGVSLKDAHVLQGLSKAKTKVSYDSLAASVRSRILPGTSRTDTNAWYVETFAPTQQRLTKGELHKIDLILDGMQNGDLREQLSKAIADDVVNTTGEAGGLLRLDQGKLTVVHATSDGESDGAFVLPKAHDPLRAIATFHVHGAHADGDASVAGPSSDVTGRRGDRGDVWRVHQDDVVVTRIARSKINVDFYTESGAVIDLGNYAL